LFGWLLANLWRFEHRPVNRVTLELAKIRPTHRVLELGCGPGWALQQASERAISGHVLGLDVSETVLLTARRANRRAIAAGRVSLRRIDGVQLGLEPRSFDRILSVHSIYFWQEPQRVLAQLAQALSPGGRLVLAFRADSRSLPARFRDEVYRFYAAAEVQNLVVAAGFSEVEVLRQPDVSPDLVWVIATA
jgi:SAM-dependent methyltransferase